MGQGFGGFEEQSDLNLRMVGARWNSQDVGVPSNTKVLWNHQINPWTIIKMAQCITQIRTGWEFWGEGRGVKTQYLSVL